VFKAVRKSSTLGYRGELFRISEEKDGFRGNDWLRMYSPDDGDCGLVLIAMIGMR